MGNQPSAQSLPRRDGFAIAYASEQKIFPTTVISIDTQMPVIDDRRRSGRGRHADERRKAELARRRAPRMRTLKGAQIIVPAGTSIGCTVRNISETGACLQLHSAVFLSHTFDLTFDDLDWARRTCRVVWRDALLMGVEFTMPEKEGGAIRRALQKLLLGRRD